jgi:Zn-dependent protease
MNDLIQTVAVYALPVLFAITLHEAAHAYAAKYFGDTTAYMMGRMSLNPAKHIDPFGTLVIPVLLYLVSGGKFLFGYAKPVPLDFGKLRKPKRDMAWVALAGPAANLIMAVLWTYAIYLMVVAGVQEPFFLKMARAGIFTNLVMMAFNLFPIPPLDGGRVLTSLLPNRYAYKFAQIEPYGFFIVMALVFFNVIYTWWMFPLIYAACWFLSLITPLSFHILFSLLFNSL